MSAGLLVYRLRNRTIEVLLVHPGGPFFKNKDEGAWSIPKGEVGPNEAPLDCARREFREEVGPVPDGPLVALAPVKQKGGKIVEAWALEGDCDVGTIASNTFRLEWPPRSGRFQDFPEIDRAEYFALELAKAKINAAQRALLDELASKLQGD
jgi:predicted NUDIX family NTP pyrophosphohydrolase